MAWKIELCGWQVLHASKNREGSVFFHYLFMAEDASLPIHVDMTPSEERWYLAPVLQCQLRDLDQFHKSQRQQQQQRWLEGNWS